MIGLLADGPENVVEARRNRLARALADFDAATIATTHGFCQEVLAGLGIAADLEPNVEFVEDLSDLLGEVVDDLYLRRFHQGEEPPFTRAQALQIAQVAVQNPDAAIAAAPGGAPTMRRGLALAVRRELEIRKQRLAVMTYDDLLTRLSAALNGRDGASIATRLQNRYDVVLVDEFQDTDPVQWDIMRRAFGGGERALVLIADPKQAIYAFRGADVYAYLEAAREAVTRATLTVNWRSDQDLIRAYDALFGNAWLGEEGIVYRHVRAADANLARRLRGAPHEAPLRIRVVPRDSIAQTNWGYAKMDGARDHIARDLAGDVVALLDAGARVELRGDVRSGSERVGPGDIAVLVPTNRGAALIRQALDDAGVPAVINGAGSVFATDTAREWLRLLEALERPASITRAHSAALTGFLGWSPARIAAADEAAWGQVHQRLHDWAKVLRINGVASLLETVTRVEGVGERLLAGSDGERRLTDLRHVGQLLHGAASTEQLGTTALTAWLRRRIVEAGRDVADEDRSRRLESDADAVQVLTVHRSKGLEFPIVYLPFLWEPGYIPDDEPISFHDPDAGNERVLDVALEGPDFKRHREQYVNEQRGEDLRLAYVALTRARHQAIVWWAGSWSSRDSPLGRLLFARDDDGRVAPSGRSTPDDAAALTRFEAVAVQAPGCVAVEQSVLGMPATWSPSLPELSELAAARFDRSVDRRWRRTSYSDITAGAYDAAALVASEAEEPGVDDEPSAEAAGAGGSPGTVLAVGADPVPLAQMNAGAEVGTLVHGVLAATEFDAPDLSAELERQIAAAQGRRAVDLGDVGAVTTGLQAVLETPLGPAVGGALRDVARADRLDELEFELPLAGGDRPDGWLTLSLIADVLREHLPADDPMAGYAERLADPVLRQNVRGYLTGSLDLVVRVGGREAPRFAVLDYKTNWLASARRAARGAPLPDGVTRRGDVPPPLCAAGAAVHGRAASLPALAGCGISGRARSGGGAVPVPARNGRPGDADCRRGLLWGVRLATAGCGGRGFERRVRSGGWGVSFVGADAFEARRVLSAGGMLGEFNAAGVLGPADVHVASRLCALAGESDESVMLAVALAARAPRLGHVHVDLGSIRETAAVDTEDPVDLSALPWPDAEAWVERVAASEIVCVGEADDDEDVRPLRLVGTWLYLDRYWSEERQVAESLVAMGGAPADGVDVEALAVGIARLFAGDSDSDGRQALAAASAVLRRLAVVAGGPGTGKTTTVARIVALLFEQAERSGGRMPMVALAAPTGKAAARLEEAVHAEARGLQVSEAISSRLLGLSASTLHRLLGRRPDSHSRFRHDRGHRLPHDVVVVDETSMVSLSMMGRLVEALRPEARLVLVGDPGQLASIEAGAVLGDIVGPAASRLLIGSRARRALEAACRVRVDADEPPAGVTIGDGIVVLERVHRFGGGIARLATAVRQGDVEGVLSLLEDPPADIVWIPVDVGASEADALEAVRAGAVAAGRAVFSAAAAGQGLDALAALGSFRVLCAHRRGPYGVATWTARVESWLRAEIPELAIDDRWYVGRPLLVTENDYELQLFNGDTGVITHDAANDPDRLVAAFERRGEIVEYSPARLSAIDTVYAMTIHKSQGSQFETAAVLLPDPSSRLLTRELLYTALTRARRRLIVAGTEEAIRMAVGRRVARASGLRWRLWGGWGRDRALASG